ncbi:TRAP transporter small permease [uncultured Fretibacterium sp.]|uniref:TRAP transporter small permease n=1 Tax=uncultured Fretibacterium sp. TaxID=1678694 RepID=UPI00325FBBE8
MKGECHQPADSTKAESAVLLICLKLLEFIDKISRWVLIVNMLLMTLLVVFQVLTRYLFSYSIAWADEVSRLTFVWAMFLAIPHGLKTGVHVGIDILVRKLPTTWFEGVSRGMMMFCALLCLVVFYYGIGATREKMQELMPILNFTAAVYYIPILISMIHSFFHLILQVIFGTKIWEGRSP